MREPKFQKGVVEILHCEFKDEKVSFWKVENDDGTNEFFIYTKNKLALIYLYFILLDDGLTARFKNPKNFPKIRNNPKKLCRLDYETLRLA